MSTTVPRKHRSRRLVIANPDPDFDPEPEDPPVSRSVSDTLKVVANVGQRMLQLERDTEAHFRRTTIPEVSLLAVPTSSPSHRLTREAVWLNSEDCKSDTDRPIDNVLAHERLLDRKHRVQRIRRTSRRLTEGKSGPAGGQHRRLLKPRQHSLERGFSVPVRLRGPRSYNSPSSASSSSSSQCGASIHDITTEVERIGEYPHTSGGFGDIWKGVWKRPGQLGEVKIAIKVLRACQANMILERKLDKRLRRELRIWQQLDHPNILPLCGVANGFGPQPPFVCQWMEKGSLTEFLKTNGQTLSLSYRLRMLRDVGNGLQYLHQKNIVHGDLTGANVLLSADGRALLSDFGLSDIIAEVKSATFLTSTVAGNLRWAAPELLATPYEEAGSDEHSPNLIQVTFQSDVYSFGSVALETLSGKVPYHYLWNDFQVFYAVNKHEKPRRPTGDPHVSDELWDFIQDCWSSPKERPSARRICERIGAFYSSARS